MSYLCLMLADDTGLLLVTVTFNLQADTQGVSVWLIDIKLVKSLAMCTLIGSHQRIIPVFNGICSQKQTGQS